MKALVFLVALILTLLVACEPPDGSDQSGADSISRKSGTASHQTAMATAAQASPPAPSSPEALSNLIYLRSEPELLSLVESICDQPPSPAKNLQFTTIYDETQLRPDLTRLPLLLHLVRQPDLPMGLRETIRGELRATLQTDHGDSWADWSLALDEHLAREHGLLRAGD